VPKVSVLVAAWNEANMIQQHVESFIGLQYPAKQMVLCAGGEDGTYELALCYASEQITVLPQYPGEGKQRALQRCLQQATGAILYLTDADCVLSDRAFVNTVAPVVFGQAKAATGWVKPLDDQLGNPFIAYLWAIQQYWIAKSGQYSEGLQGGNSALLRSSLDHVGGFRADAPIGEDYHLAQRLIASGYWIRAVPSSHLRTRYPALLRDYCRQKSRWSRGNILHALRFRSWRKMRQELRISSVALFVLLIPATLGGRSPTMWALWGLVVAHLLMDRVRMLLTLRVFGHYRNVHILGYVLPMVVYTFVDCFASVRALLECVVPSWRWRW
jgi:cellulose synthase/poly-beta-1,6-N-acetylglucosamine synthase-like glycosyltransferase